MRPPSRIEQRLAELGVAIDPQLFDLALTHRSYAYEHGGVPTNERLEFLGDAVLGVLVTDYLYVTYPESPEGQLAKLRAAVVNARSLADVARSLDVGTLLKLGRGELTTGGRDKSSILADCMEALIAAVYLSGGMDAAATLVHALFDPLIETAAGTGAGLDWKTSLQELCGAHGWEMPTYEVAESGPDHDKRFTAHAVVHGQSFGPGEGRNKKQAEQEAARAVYAQLRELPLPAVNA